MATERFEYRHLPGVVSLEQAGAALDFTPGALIEEAGLRFAACPLCGGVLHCKLLPGALVDLCCYEGCGAQEVVVAVREQAEVDR